LEMSSLVDRQRYPEKHKANLVPQKGDTARVVVKGVKVRCGDVVVDERVLGRSALEQLGAAFFGVCVDGGNVVDIGNRKDNEASKTKPFSWIGRLLRTISGTRERECFCREKGCFWREKGCFWRERVLVSLQMVLDRERVLLEREKRIPLKRAS